jgi:hypothetical protein
MNGTRRASALAILVGVGLVLAGCTQSPLAPGDSARGVSVAPPIVAFAPDGSVDYVWAPIDTMTAESANLAGAAPSPRSVSASVWIEGTRGGMVRAGRFSVKVPAGAFSGTAIVTLSMPDSTVMVCDLAITPSSANAFKVPAQLVADFSSTNIQDVSTLTMYWYDPNRLTWVNCSSKSRTLGAYVTMYLDHFSRYAAGKAGW